MTPSRIRRPLRPGVLCLWVLPILSLLGAAAAPAATTYEIRATLDPAESRAEGRVVLRWTNETAEPIDRLPMAFANPESEDLIGEATVDGEAAQVEPSQEDSAEGFDLVPPEPIGPGETAQLEMAFTSTRVEPPSGMRYVAFDQGWFPLAPSVRDGRLRPDEEELADFRVELRFPSELEMACTGRILSERREEGATIYETEARGVSGYGFAYHADLEVLETEAAEVRIRSFYFKEDEKWGRKLLDMAADIVAFYREEIGFYPQPVLDILPGYDRPFGGYPVTPNVVTIHRGLDEKGDQAEDFARWIMAHEIGHQYWGFGTVLEDPRFVRWFGLSMGIYTDRLYSRARGLDRSLHDDFRWRYLGGVLAGVDTTILRDVERVEELEWDWNNILAHGKSFAVLEMLEYVLGEDRFLEVFREALRRFRGRVVTMEAFRDLCEEIGGRDLGWFFHQWYETGAVLDYRLGETRTWRDGETFVVEADVWRRGEAVMPVEVALETVDGELIRERTSGWSERGTVTFRSASAPRRVLLDPDRRLALVSRARSEWEVVEQASRTLLLSLQRPAEAGELLEGVEKAAGENPYYWYLLGLSRMYAGDFPGAEEAFERIEPLEGRTGWERYRARGLLRLGNLRDLQGRREEAVELYRRCVELEASRDEAARYLETPFERRP